MTALFGGAGWWLDGLLHTFPILMALGAIAGLAGTIYVMALRLKEIDKEPKQGSDTK